MSEHEHDEDGYTGGATLLVEETAMPVEVELRGYFQPIDGYYHWYGRIKPNRQLADLAGGRKKTAEIRTPQGSAIGEISDPDPWDRYRITGTSTPPFAIPASLEEIEG